jgi:hypothetical protein
MKKFLNGVFVFLLATALLVGVVASPASAAAITYSGYTVAPYWFTGIDTDGRLSGDLPLLFQNSAQYVIYRPGFNAAYYLAAHPNYQPNPDDETLAQTTTVVTAIQRYNPGGVKEDCIAGGTFQVPFNYADATSAGIFYLKFSIAFTTYNNHTGAVVGTYSFDPVYFKLNTITPPPAPTYEF